MLELRFWALYAGDLRKDRREVKWAQELAIAEYRLDVRAQEEKVLDAMRKHREMGAAKKPNLRPRPGYLAAYVPKPEVVIEPTPLPFTSEFDRRLWDPTTDDDEVTLALIPHSNRYTLSSQEPEHIKARIDSEMRDRGLDSLCKHPLILRYERARQAAIDKGDPDPGDLAPLLARKTPRHRLNDRLRYLHAPATYTDANGVHVQRGFDVSKRDATTTASQPATTLAFLPRNRSHTCDDRFWSAKMTAHDEASGLIPQPSLRRPGTAAEIEVSLIDRAMQSVDPAEGIAKYHELRRNWFQSGGSLMVDALVSRGTWA